MILAQSSQDPPLMKKPNLAKIFKFENRHHNPNLFHYRLKIKYESVIHAHNDKHIKLVPVSNLHDSSSKFTGPALD